MHNHAIEPNRLDDLLSKDYSAKEYFMALGEAEQGMLRQRSNEIETLDDMERMAQHLRY